MSTEKAKNHASLALTFVKTAVRLIITISNDALSAIHCKYSDALKVTEICLSVFCFIFSKTGAAPIVRLHVLQGYLLL